MLPDKTEQIDIEVLTAEVTPGYQGMLEVAPAKYAYQKRIKKVIIPDGTEVINQEAFFYCNNLEEIVLPASLRFINYKAFDNCKRLRKVIYNGTAKSWAAIKIYDDSPEFLSKIPTLDTNLWEYTIKEDNTLRLDKYKVTTLAGIECPDQIDGREVTEIAEDCLSNRVFTEITLPRSLREIGKGMFSRCTKLETIHIPDTVTKICEVAFYLCASLRSVTFENQSKLTEIETNAFYGCTSLKEFVLPASLRTLQSYALRNCTALEEINIPARLSLIGVGAFLGCDSVERVTVAKGNMKFITLGGCLVENIDSKQVLLYCPATFKNEIAIHMDVDEIYPHAFHGCKGITSIVLPDSVTTIWDSAFYDCIALETINLDRVTSIGGIAFLGCKSLESITVNAKQSFGSSVFEDCTGLKTVEIKEGVRSLNPGSFRGCASLETITLPSTLTHIAQDAFYGIPGHVEIIFKGSVSQWNTMKYSIPKTLDYNITYVE